MRAWAACGFSHAFSEELNNKKSAELPKMRHLCLMGGEGAGLMKALILSCSRLMKMSEKAAVGSGTLTRPVLRLSLIH